MNLLLKLTGMLCKGSSINSMDIIMLCWKVLKTISGVIICHLQLDLDLLILLEPLISRALPLGALVPPPHVTSPHDESHTVCRPNQVYPLDLPSPFQTAPKCNFITL